MWETSTAARKPWEVGGVCLPQQEGDQPARGPKPTNQPGGVHLHVLGPGAGPVPKFILTIQHMSITTAGACSRDNLPPDRFPAVGVTKAPSGSDFSSERKGRSVGAQKPGIKVNFQVPNTIFGDLMPTSIFGNFNVSYYIWGFFNH